MANFRHQALEALRFRAEADKVEAEASLSMLLEHPAGVGEHSTGDLHDNLNEALAKLADAEDRLGALSRYHARNPKQS